MSGISLEQITSFVRTLLHEQDTAKIRLEEASVQVALVKRIEDDLLPNMMREIDVLSFKLGDGRTVSVEPNISCSVTEVMWPKTYAWLQENDFDAIVKNQVIMEFDKGQDMAAENMLFIVNAITKSPSLFQAVLDECKIPDREGDMVDAFATVYSKKNIHPQTLKAFVREQMKQGRDVPEDLFSLFITDHVKIK